ncbi:MAG: DUF2799 domain-containing protein [Bdellovibrionales bacterium]|nr:DUF2799 domain-containing protein [Bdellovibrionales bacterium]
MISISPAFHLSLWTALMVLLGACAGRSERVTCAQRDWYEVGRRDGSQGRTLERLSNYKKDCGGFESPWETLYTNGRNAGLVEFCASENAYELGRMGLSYMNVCPSTMEEDFLLAFRKGQQARVLQLRAKDLDAKIETLTERLLQTHADSYENRSINSELAQLKKLRAVNERELNRVTK